MPAPPKKSPRTPWAPRASATRIASSSALSSLARPDLARPDLAKPNLPEEEAPKRVRRLDGELTEGRVFQTALLLFRKKGFDATTMRDIARGAGLSLGAAYHYFPSKDAIVTQIFRQHLTRHGEAVEAAYARTQDLGARLRAAFETSFEVRREDRALLGSLAKITLGDNPASLFSPATESLRQRSIDVFRRAVEVEEVPPEGREVVATALWALHLGLLLLFVRDGTPHQEKTYRVLERVLNLLPTFVGLAGSPVFAPFRSEIEAILAELRAP
jgi:AcrR family transcriptional regulator